MTSELRLHFGYSLGVAVRQTIPLASSSPSSYQNTRTGRPLAVFIKLVSLSPCVSKALGRGVPTLAHITFFPNHDAENVWAERRVACVRGLCGSGNVSTHCLHGRALYISPLDPRHSNFLFISSAHPQLYSATYSHSYSTLHINILPFFTIKMKTTSITTFASLALAASAAPTDYTPPGGWNSVAYPANAGSNLPSYPAPAGGWENVKYPPGTGAGASAPAASAPAGCKNGPFTFTSTFHVVATPDQVVNGTRPTGGLAVSCTAFHRHTELFR